MQQTKVGGVDLALMMARQTKQQIVVWMRQALPFNTDDYKRRSCLRVCLCIHIIVTFPLVLMTSMMDQCEAWGLLFPPSWTDVLVWPLILASDAIYHPHDWEPSLNTARWKPKTLQWNFFSPPFCCWKCYYCRYLKSVSFTPFTITGIHFR